VKEDEPAAGADDELIGKLLKPWLEQRNKARRDRNFKLADATRAELDELGIVLEDKPEGTTWRRK
jgi:cysteinyl-tRNA synthetase